LAAAPDHFVLVVDDDQRFRTFVRDLLEGAGFRVVDVSTGDEALAFARVNPPDLVVLDVCLPGISGYEVLRQLQETVREDLPIVLMSGQRTDKQDWVSALHLGADDHLVKPFEPDELLARVRRSLARTANGNGHGALLGSTSPLEILTFREREVLSLLTSGLTQSQIATQLVISPRTVGTHIHHILTKLDVHSRAQAVALALRIGFDRGEAPRPVAAADVP
jgi:DNA-binding NarL/FixJ family response regulator